MKRFKVLGHVNGKLDNPSQGVDALLQLVSYRSEAKSSLETTFVVVVAPLVSDVDVGYVGAAGNSLAQLVVTSDQGCKIVMLYPHSIQSLSEFAHYQLLLEMRHCFEAVLAFLSTCDQKL